ncbi:MAG: transporter permease [Verrucomicrobiales bacterium]|nr:transporter permease [Verrucomicrobiales bacterium]
MRRLPSYAFMLLLLAGMWAFFVYPIWITVQEAFRKPGGGWTMEFVGQIFGNALYREGLINSLKMAAGSTLGALILALPLALLGARHTFPGKGLLSSLLLVPLILPPFVGTIGIKEIMGQHGALNALFFPSLTAAGHPPDWLGTGRLTGVVLMNALHLYPILYLNITAALANLDPAMDEAAANLGCPPWRRFWKITLPLAMPGIFAGTSIVFIWGFTELGVPLMFAYSRVTSVQIFDGIKDIGGNPLPYALVAVMLAASVLMFLLSKFLFGRSDFAGSGRAGMASQTPALRGGKGWLATGAFSLVILLAVMPHLGVVLASVATDWYDSVLPSGYTLQHYRDALSHGLTVPSIINSLKYAGLATLIDVALGVTIAWITVRTKLPGRNLLDALAMLPIAVPGLVLAFGYLAMTREDQPFDFLIGDNGDPYWIIVVAYAMRRLLYVVRSASAGLQQTSVSLEEAARNLGASPFRTLRRITLPLIGANLLAGALLAFAFGMLEVSDSLILAQKGEHYPITKAIYNLNAALGNGEALASALGVWAMVFLTITLIGTGMLLGKKMGAMFRA